MFKMKLIAVSVVLLLGGSGAAFAATGHVPETVKSLVGVSQASAPQDSQNEISAAGDQYSGGGVSTVAKDKSVTGTMTLPNGKEIENHGLAVSQAAKAQQDDNGNGDQPQAQTTTGGENKEQLSTQLHQDGENGTASSQSQGSQHGRP